MRTARTVEVGDYVRVRHHGKALPGIWELLSIAEGLVTVRRIGWASPRYLSQASVELRRVQRART